MRLALKDAIDRQDVIDKILFGYGSLGNDHPIAPSMPYFAELGSANCTIPTRRSAMDKSASD